MPQPQAYQTLIEETIKISHKKGSLSSQTILCQVIETLMECERDVFLTEEIGNKGNGFYRRFINHFQGRFEIKVPRDRLGQFTPLTLEIIQQDQEKMNALALSLYSQGVSHRGTSRIFKELFSCHYSPGKLSQLVKAFEPRRVAWQQRRLDDEYHVLLVDAIYHSVKRGQAAQEATYIVMGLKADYTREILGLYHLPTESSQGWKQVFTDLTARGLKQVGLVLCDELSGIETAIEQHLPHRAIQTCLVHKLRRLIAHVRHTDKAHIISDWQSVLRLDESEQLISHCHQRLIEFIEKWSKKYPTISRLLPENKWHYYFAYCRYPVQLRRLLYTTNWIERLNKEIRKTTRHVGSFPNPDSVLNLIFMVTQQMEENTYRYPITSFYPFKHTMNQILFNTTQTQDC